MSDQWETFCDVGYYHMWRLRRKTERGWNDGFHINTKAEAEELCELLNKLERESDEWKAKFINQNKDLGCEMMDPAGTIWDYASATQRENVQLKREVERERALANEAIATWKKTREERDAALIGYNECRATIEDARRALGATAHEGPLLAAMRVTEQRDRLAEALRELCETLLNDKPRDITESLYKAGDALAAWKGGSDDKQTTKDETEDGSPKVGTPPRRRERRER
jgi:hypothetical protein